MPHHLGACCGLRHFDGDAIITNPPYELAAEFIERALSLTASDGLVAMLLRTDFDHAKSRQHLFQHPAFRKKLVLTKRIKWFEDSEGQPSFNHAWSTDPRILGSPPVRLSCGGWVVAAGQNNAWARRVTSLEGRCSRCSATVSPVLPTVSRGRNRSDRRTKAVQPASYRMPARNNFAPRFAAGDVRQPQWATRAAE
jgi:hypothetical protein